VSFDEALTVFADPLARIFDDQDHSMEERNHGGAFCSKAPAGHLLLGPGRYRANIQRSPGHQT